MAVTVKIENKVKAAPAAAEIADYALPNLKGEGGKAFGIWMVVMVVLCGLFLPLEATRPLGIIFTAWWLLSSFAYFIMAPRIVLRRLRLEGGKNSITAQRQPRLKTLLSKGSATISVAEPEGFLLNDSTTQVQILGGDPFMLVSQGATENLLPPELDCLALRCLIHAKLGSVKRLSLLKFLNDTPAGMRVLAWPVVMYGALLRTGWSDAAEQSADRLTLLLVKNPKLLMSAILKQFASCDPQMQERNISAEDVDTYIKQGGLIGATGTEISTQYKIGSAIKENPTLDERLRALTAWVNTPEYVLALEKLSARSKPTAPAAPDAQLTDAAQPAASKTV